MAICSSSFGLSTFCNEIFDSSSNHLTGEVRALRLRPNNIECCSFVKETTITLSVSSRYRRKRTGRFQIRSMLQQPNDDESKSIDMTTGVASSLAAEVKSSSSSSSSSEKDSRATVEDNGGGSFGGKDDSGGGGGGDGDGGSDDHEEEDNSEEVEFGPLMKFEEVLEEMKARGASLPLDMLEAAKTVGIRKLLLSRYFDLQGSLWPLGFGMRYISWFRNRMLADPSFLFKVGIEVLIDSTCATFAEVQKRGENFWAEFELFVADLLVGLVVDIALVGLLAPYARFGKPSVSVSKGFLGQMRRASATLPSSVFEAERPGSRFSVQQRVATYFYKGVLYGSVGFVCGLIGQGIANSIMTAKRSIKKSDEDIPVPPLVKSAALWGVFLAVSSNTRYQVINGLERLVEASPLAKKVPPAAMAFTVGVRFANNIYGGVFLAVSSNTRYQIINGLERLVEASPLAKKVPPAAMAFTVGVRFANNIYGGMQFVDWARLSGCQ